MNIKLLGQISHLDTSVLQVEWFGDEHAKEEVGGSSAGGWPIPERLIFVLYIYR